MGQLLVIGREQLVILIRLVIALRTSGAYAGMLAGFWFADGMSRIVVSDSANKAVKTILPFGQLVAE